MKARIVRIGNSHGIRLPKAVLEQSGLTEEVEIDVQHHQITIRPVEHPRTGWDDAFKEMAANGDDALLDADAPTGSTWDQEEWEW